MSKSTLRILAVLLTVAIIVVIFRTTHSIDIDVLNKLKW